MTFTPYPDAPMSETELKAAEAMMLCGEISQSDLLWLMGLEQDESDRPPPRGFKSWEHFGAFKWHMERKRLGLARPKKRRKAA